MTVQYSGYLLVTVRNRPFAGLLADASPLAIPGYRLAPLFNGHLLLRCFRRSSRPSLAFRKSSQRRGNRPIDATGPRSPSVPPLSYV